MGLLPPLWPCTQGSLPKAEYLCPTSVPFFLSVHWRQGLLRVIVPSRSKARYDGVKTAGQCHPCLLPPPQQPCSTSPDPAPLPCLHAISWEHWGVTLPCSSPALGEVPLGLLPCNSAEWGRGVVSGKCLQCFAETPCPSHSWLGP